MITLWNLLPIVLAALPAVIHAQIPTLAPPVLGVPAKVTAFVDVHVVPMDTDRVLSGHTVLVEGGRITALGPVSQVKVPNDALRIDGREKYLIPGLADMHAHLGSLGSNESKLLDYLAHGVTTIRNMEWDTPRESAAKSLQLRARAATGELLSPRIYTGVRYIGTDTPEDIAAQVTAFKAAGYDFIKVRSESPLVFHGLTEAARRVGLEVVGHYPLDYKGNFREVFSLDQVLASGLRSIEHVVSMPGFFRDSIQQQSKIAALRRAGIWVCPTLAIYNSMATGSPDTSSLRKLPSLVHWLQQGSVGLLLGTDAGASSVSSELQAYVSAELTPYQALATGTRNIAAYTKTSDESGTIAVGKRADLVLLTGNPLVNVETVKQPEGTMLQGRWLPRTELVQRLLGVEGKTSIKP